MRYLAILLFLCCGCQQEQEAPKMQNIMARDQRPTYRAIVPAHWKAVPTTSNLQDTMLPLIEYQVEGVSITVHNFPSQKMEQRIPAQAQVERWKKQFTYLEPMSIEVTPQAHGGFSGLLFEGEGILDEKRQKMIAWSMLIAPMHYQTLDHLEKRQMLADYTIKVVGDVDPHRDEIFRFANSFELIESIPQPL